MNNSKNRIFLGFILLSFLSLGLKFAIEKRRSFFQKRLESEEIKKQFPSDLDQEHSAWSTLAYGYQLGAWPTTFNGNPVFSTLNYHKGPPEKFIPEMKLIWEVGKAEISIEGPRTPIENFTAVKWKTCLQNYYFCQSKKKKFVDAALVDLKKYHARIKKLAWFEVDGYSAPRGLHVQIILENTQIDRYTLITENGITQNFTLTASRYLIGDEARILFLQTLGSMTVKNDLSEARAWMAKKMGAVQLQKVRSIPDPKLKYWKLIQIKNILFAELAINPTLIAPFFHLAGVSHLLGTSLIREKKTYYENQEAWIIDTTPLLSSLVKYVKDFPESQELKVERTAALANMESLLQDFLLLEKKASKFK